MGGVIGRLLGSGKALEGVVDAATKGLDALVHTDEEQATEAAAARSEARQMVVDWMRSTQGQNLARRLIALVIAGLWVFMYVIALALDVASIWVADPTQLKQAAAAIGERAHELNGAMMLILGFYFAAPHLGDISRAALSRFGGTQTKTKAAT